MAQDFARRGGMGPAFGDELRRLRRQAGLSLRALAREVRYDAGHLSRIEWGLRRPSEELARICDSVLDGRGRLLELLPGSAAPAARAGHPAAPASPDAGTGGHRHRGGATAVHGPVPGRPGPLEGADVWRPEGPDSAAVAEAFRRAAWHLRLLGRQVPAPVVLPTVAEQVRTLRGIALTGRSPDRALLRLAAHTAEFAGWMAQESGQSAAAREWTAEAGRLASLSAFHDLRGYSLVRRAELEMYAGRADAVIELCEAVYHRRCYSLRVRAFAAQRAAQGYAMRKEAVASLRALDRAREMWSAQPDVQPDALLLGSAAIGDPTPLVHGWIWLDLGQPGRAAEHLHAALVPARRSQGRRVRALFGARAARALAEGGELQEAVRVGRRAFRAAEMTRSATALGELRLLAAALERAPRHRPALDLVREIRSVSAFGPAAWAWGDGRDGEGEPR